MLHSFETNIIYWIRRVPSLYSESCELSSFLIKETLNLLQNSHFLYLPRKVKSGPLLRAIWTGHNTHNSELLLLWQYARQQTAMCWTIQHAIHWATLWALDQAIQRAMLYGQYTMVMLSIGWVGGWVLDNAPLQWQCAQMPILVHYNAMPEMQQGNAVCTNITIEMQW